MQTKPIRKLRTQVSRLEAIKSPSYLFIPDGAHPKVYDFTNGTMTFLGWWVNGQITMCKAG